MAGFVVLEGIDGCGKSTVARLVAKRLGKRAILTKEPTDSKIGKAARTGDARRISPFTDALLFMADRAQHTIRISELVNSGRLVVSDRYYHSTVAYQAAFLKGKFKGDPYRWLLEANTRISIHPDLTFLLTIPPEIALERVGKRGKLSRFERLDFLQEVHRNYLRLARTDKSIIKVDARQDLEEVVGEVLSHIRKRKL